MDLDMDVGIVRGVVQEGVGGGMWGIGHSAETVLSPPSRWLLRFLGISALDVLSRFSRITFHVGGQRIWKKIIFGKECPLSTYALVRFRCRPRPQY